MWWPQRNPIQLTEFKSPGLKSRFHCTVRYRPKIDQFREYQPWHEDLRQLLQQRFGLPKIGSVKALGKPRVDLSQQVVRLLPFSLL
jgi:hypothetical protein